MIRLILDICISILTIRETIRELLLKVCQLVYEWQKQLFQFLNSKTMDSIEWRFGEGDV